MKKKQDFYTKKAREEGLVARSAYKLKQIQKRFNIIKPGHNILDLGCSPGGWSKFALQLIGPQGNILGIDTSPVKIKDERFTFLQEDLYESEKLQKLPREFNVVMSDAAPKTTGQKELDRERSEDLARNALKIAKQKLVPGGNFVCKIFQGEYYEKFLQDVRKNFNYVRSCKPEASKNTSREMYIVGKGYGIKKNIQ